MLIGRRVTVLGAGIGGLAAALALALRGAQVTVLEQAAELSEIGAGLQISPNGAAVLDALGLGPALAQRGLRADAAMLRDGPSGRAVLRVPLGQGAHPWMFMHRADLIDILAQAARGAGIQIRLLQKITGVDLSGPRACLTTAQGARMQADLVIGADGINSHLRVALNGAASARFTGQVAWRAIVPGQRPISPQAQLFMGPGRHLVTYPLRDGALTNIVAVEERSTWAPESWSHQDDPANLRAGFSGFAPAVTNLLAQVDQVHLWGLFRHPVAVRWHGHNAALLGDAAHPTLPFLAQGANMALEDAWVLAAALAGHDDIAAGLAAYQAARAPRCTRIVQAAGQNAQLYHLRTGPLRRAAHLGMRLGNAVMPQRLAGRFGWIHDHDVTRVSL